MTRFPPVSPAALLKRLLLALAVLCGLAAGAAAQDAYLLQPGDQIRLTITEIPQSETIATVDISGAVQFPRFGAFQATGMTLSDLQSNVSAAATGSIVSYFSAAGNRVEVTLSGNEIFLQIAEYRPVYVQGHVARPGPVPFQPGLTVRAAITVAGGESTQPGFLQNSLMNVPNIRSEYETQALRHASAVVRLWAIEASLARNPDLPRPDLSAVAVPPEVFERLIVEQAEQVTYNLSGYVGRRASLEERKRILDERVALLSKAIAQQEEAVAIEEEDVARVAQLQAKGIASTARLSDARQSLLLVSSRLLGVQDSVAQFTLLQKDAEEKLNLVDTEYERPLQAERAEVLNTVWAAQSEIEAARQSLEMTGSIVGPEASVDDANVRITIIRSSIDGPLSLESALDDPVLPGDVIRVRIEGLAAGFASPLAPLAPPAAAPAQ